MIRIFSAAAIVLLFFTSCGNPGFTDVPTESSKGDAANPVNSSPQRAKPSAFEIVTAAGNELKTQNGAKVSLSVGNINDQSKIKTANGFQVFLSVSGQNFSQ